MARELLFGGGVLGWVMGPLALSNTMVTAAGWQVRGGKFRK